MHSQLFMLTDDTQITSRLDKHISGVSLHIVHFHITMTTGAHGTISLVYCPRHDMHRWDVPGCDGRSPRRSPRRQRRGLARASSRSSRGKRSARPARAPTPKVGVYRQVNPRQVSLEHCTGQLAHGLRLDDLRGCRCRRWGGAGGCPGRWCQGCQGPWCPRCGRSGEEGGGRPGGVLPRGQPHGHTHGASRAPCHLFVFNHDSINHDLVFSMWRSWGRLFSMLWTSWRARPASLVSASRQAGRV